MDSRRPVVLISVTWVLFIFLIVRISVAICSNDTEGEKISGYFSLLQRMASVIYSEKGKKKKQFEGIQGNQCLECFHSDFNRTEKCMFPAS